MILMLLAQGLHIESLILIQKGTGNGAVGTCKAEVQGHLGASAPACSVLCPRAHLEDRLP